MMQIGGPFLSFPWSVETERGGKLHKGRTKLKGSTLKAAMKSEWVKVDQAVPIRAK
ncbi:MAG: hypothetical protein AAF468_17510 [Pseudomonadota bacterium]